MISMITNLMLYGIVTISFSYFSWLIEIQSEKKKKINNIDIKLFQIKYFHLP